MKLKVSVLLGILSLLLFATYCPAPTRSFGTTTAVSPGTPTFRYSGGVWQSNTGLDETWLDETTTPDTYTVLLLHGDGENAGTVFTDSEFPLAYIESEFGTPTARTKTVTGTGDVYTDTSLYKFGGSSIYNGTTGTDTGYLAVADCSDWTLGDTFTIDFWVKMDNDAGYLLMQGEDGGAYRNWVVRFGTTWVVFGYTGQYVGCSFSGLNAWHHIAIVRNGHLNWAFYVDGVSQALTFTDGNFDIPDLASQLLIGRYGFDTNLLNQGEGFIGHYDELRISKGVARFTANFSDKLSARAYPY